MTGDQVASINRTIANNFRPKFITLHDTRSGMNGTTYVAELHINAAWVSMVTFSYERGGTELTVGGKIISVDEDPKEVMALIEA